jgi:hypothetical protein
MPTGGALLGRGVRFREVLFLCACLWWYAYAAPTRAAAANSSDAREGVREVVQSALLEFVGKPANKELDHVDLGAKLTAKGLEQHFPLEACVHLRYSCCVHLPFSCCWSGLACDECSPGAGNEAQAARKRWRSLVFRVRRAQEVRFPFACVHAREPAVVCS